MAVDWAARQPLAAEALPVVVLVCALHTQDDQLELPGSLPYRVVKLLSPSFMSGLGLVGERAGCNFALHDGALSRSGGKSGRVMGNEPTQSARKWKKKQVVFLGQPADRGQAIQCTYVASTHRT